MLTRLETKTIDAVLTWFTKFHLVPVKWENGRMRVLSPSKKRAITGTAFKLLILFLHILHGANGLHTLLTSIQSGRISVFLFVYFMKTLGACSVVVMRITIWSYASEFCLLVNQAFQLNKNCGNKLFKSRTALSLRNMNLLESNHSLYSGTDLKLLKRQYAESRLRETLFCLLQISMMLNFVLYICVLAFFDYSSLVDGIMDNRASVQLIKILAIPILLICNVILTLDIFVVANLLFTTALVCLIILKFWLVKTW
jgi:hypothetical protein